MNDKLRKIEEIDKEISKYSKEYNRLAVEKDNLLKQYNEELLKKNLQYYTIGSFVLKSDSDSIGRKCEYKNFGLFSTEENARKLILQKEGKLTVTYFSDFDVNPSVTYKLFIQLVTPEEIENLQFNITRLDKTPKEFLNNIIY
jgi:hypothetical protein